jgi:hypothetical protein
MEMFSENKRVGWFMPLKVIRRMNVATPDKKMTNTLLVIFQS